MDLDSYVDIDTDNVDIAMDWFLSSQYSYVEVLIPYVTVLEIGTLEGVIKVKCGRKGGALIWKTGVSVRRGRDSRNLSASLSVHTEKMPYEEH